MGSTKQTKAAFGRGRWAGLVAALGLALGAQAAPMNFAERVACHAAVERVYHELRQGSLHQPFEQAVPAALLQQRAGDALRMSALLAQRYGLAIDAAMLQTELDRMAAQTRSPHVLAALFAAVGHDPQRAAECIARPLLAERLLRAQFDDDARVHAAPRRAADAARRTLAADALPADARRMAWLRGLPAPGQALAGARPMEPARFDAQRLQWRQSFEGSAGWLPLRAAGNHFVSARVLRDDGQRFEVATLAWPRTGFDAWWARERVRAPMVAAATAGSLRLSAVAADASCRDDSWAPTQALPDPRYRHTAVWTGSEMIVWGGMSYVGNPFGDGARYNPATDSWAPMAQRDAPEARAGHQAVWTGREMLVFGGSAGVTGARYEPVTDTWRPMAPMSALMGLDETAAVWTGTEVLAWGGYGPAGASNAGARYDPRRNLWTPMATAPLAPRGGMPAVWTGREMIVWSGYNVSIGTLYGDGAAFDPRANRWRALSALQAPSARFNHTAVWSGSEMIVWGGVGDASDSTGARYDPRSDTWRPTSTAGAPEWRQSHGAVWTGTDMLVLGGTGGLPELSPGGRYNPVADAWTSLPALGNGISRGEASYAWTGREFIAWGGQDSNAVFRNDGLRFDAVGSRWRSVNTLQIPRAQGFHGAAWTGAELVVFGGDSGFFEGDPGGRYDPALDTWRLMSTVGAPPSAGTTATWTGQEVIFWAGDASNGRYDPATDTWRGVSPVNQPLATIGHSVVWTGREMIVFGGISSSRAAKRYDPVADAWTDASTANGPGRRNFHGAVWTGTEMIVWGGSIDSGELGPRGGRYNPATDTWVQIPRSAGQPRARAWPVSVWTGTEALFWGGYDFLYLVEFADGGRYDPATSTWRATSLAGAPAPRIAQGVWTGTEMIVWGGQDDDSGGRYDPAADTWRPTTLSRAPDVPFGGRFSTVWTGEQMIVWGGAERTQAGGLYCASGAANTAPVAADEAYTVAAGRRRVVGVAEGVLRNDTDANRDPLTARLVQPPAHGQLRLSPNGSFVYEPGAGYTGADSFRYRAHDDLAGSAPATVSITVR